MALLSCVHQPNPQDPSRWDVAPGSHKAFSELCARAHRLYRDSSDAQPTPPITADALQSFLAPGVTTWLMTSADLPALAQKINERRG